MTIRLLTATTTTDLNSKMEVADSHMSEHFPTHLPSHADIDMSGEYYDEEYIMHDATEATNDEEIEIYDAETDEQPGHDEVEMDEYTDEIVDDNETHMGTYVPGDDATVTDVTVEDVQLRSSPVAPGTPRGAPLRPISPHETLDVDLITNEAPADTLAPHSPHSVATLIDDSEIHPAQTEGAKEEYLNEVIDLTEADDQPRDWPVDIVESVEPELDVSSNEPDPPEQEVYEGEGVPVETGSPEVRLAASDQLLGEEVTMPVNAASGDVADAPDHLEILEQLEQGGHSPIEEALVINQQVRDDAADSMEPSPPVHLHYKEVNLGIDQTFDVFAPSNPNSQNVQTLFRDNRTLYYEPLSSFFAQLRETEYFSGSTWQDAEMELKLDLGTSALCISEDHKDTDKVSLFDLSSIWSGLGLEGPLRLMLQRHAERFSVRFARLVEQVEQGDLQNDETEDLHEVHVEAEAQIYVEDEPLGDHRDTIQREVEGDIDDTVGEGGEDQEAGDPHVTEGDPRPHDTHENESENGGEGDNAGTRLCETLDDQLQETGTTQDAQNTESSEPDPNSERSAQNHDIAPAQQNVQNAPLIRPQNVTRDVARNADSRDNDENPSVHGLPLSLPETDPEVPQDDEYNEYEIEIGLAPQETGPNIASATRLEHAEANEYDEYEDYEDADEDQSAENHPPIDLATDDQADPDETKVSSPTAQAEVQGSTSNSSLKRNIDDLAYEKYDTPSAPSSPASEYKRIKHT